MFAFPLPLSKEEGSLQRHRAVVSTLKIGATDELVDRCTVQYLVDVRMRTYLGGTHFATDGALIRGLGRGGSYFVLKLSSLDGNSSDV